MGKVTSFQKLDKLLFEFKDLNYHAIPYLIGLLHAKNIDYKTEEIKLAIRKLLDDGYLSDMGGGNYKITFDGQMFIGYEKKQILDNETIEALSISKEEARKYSHRLLWATWSAGIVAALLLLWQVWIWFYPVHANYPYWIWETIPKGKR